MRKQTGFTLIEIAIVLVIIGLLLGGVLIGQELITSSRVRNVATMRAYWTPWLGASAARRHAKELEKRAQGRTQLKLIQPDERGPRS